MPVTLRRFTVDEVDAFPDDGNRYELLGGMLLVTPAPGLPHQTVAMRLAGMLFTFLLEESDVRVWAPGVILIRPDLKLEPDILVGRVRPGTKRWEDVQDRWLAVEVSGTSSRVYDRDYKSGAYLEIGVREVWRVDLASRQVTVSRPDQQPTAHETVLTWRSPETGRQLRIEIPALFQDVPLGE